MVSLKGETIERPQENGAGSGPCGKHEKTIEAQGNPIRGQTTKGPNSSGPKVADFHGRQKSLKPGRLR
jgi:hypothetical protein